MRGPGHAVQGVQQPRSQRPCLNPPPSSPSWPRTAAGRARTGGLPPATRNKQGCPAVRLLRNHRLESNLNPLLQTALCGPPPGQDSLGRHKLPYPHPKNKTKKKLLYLRVCGQLRISPCWGWKDAHRGPGLLARPLDGGFIPVAGCNPSLLSAGLV